jgi:hypothetical protein
MYEPVDTIEPVTSRSPLPAIFLGSVLFVGLAVLLHSQQGAVLTTTDRIAGQLDDEGKLRPLADVIETTRALKLVTVMIDSTVRTEVHDEGWRGKAAASVKAPVRYVYGVDLSGLDPDAIRMGHILGIYEITIPRPTRIAVEVDGSHPIEETVDVTGMRFRKVAGEYYQGLARKEIYEKARQSSLPDETLEKIDTQTREQVESLVRRFVGPSAEVRVKYADKK